MTSQTIKPEYLTVPEAATLLGVSVRTIRRHIADGALTAYKIGGTAVRLRITDVRGLAQLVDPQGYAHASGGER